MPTKPALHCLLLLSAIVKTGCGERKAQQTPAPGNYQISIAPAGQIYRLDVASGDVVLIENMPTLSNGRTKLVAGSFYEDEHGRTLRYVGDGKFELMPTVDEIFNRHFKKK